MDKTIDHAMDHAMNFRSTREAVAAWVGAQEIVMFPGQQFG
jgi:hypothetical protein